MAALLSAAVWNTLELNHNGGCVTWYTSTQTQSYRRMCKCCVTYLLTATWNSSTVEHLMFACTFPALPLYYGGGGGGDTPGYDAAAQRLSGDEAIATTLRPWLPHASIDSRRQLPLIVKFYWGLSRPWPAMHGGDAGPPFIHPDRKCDDLHQARICIRRGSASGENLHQARNGVKCGGSWVRRNGITGNGINLLWTRKHDFTTTYIYNIYYIYIYV